MKLYSVNGNKLTSISGRDFKFEKDIQTIVENNLDGLFNLQFVKSELRIKNFRVDTLAFDPENKSFIVYIRVVLLPLLLVKKGLLVKYACCRK